jgi:CRP-like cAMP-binding protein
LLDSLPEPERERLIASLNRHIYQRGEVLFHAGDPADTLHLLFNGHVSARVALASGDFVVVAVLGPGEVFGELALVAQPRPRAATIIALDRCETLTLRRCQFEDLRLSYPGIDRLLVELLAARVDRINAYLLEALYVSADKRVLRRLLELCDLYAPETDRVAIPLTQETVASLAGTTRSTANQVLQRLAAGQVVELARGHIDVLDRETLRRRAGLS